MKESISPQRLLKTAERAARAGGEHALRNKARRRETLETFAHDLKLVLDLECQRVVERIVLSDFPDHGILGEENVRAAPADQYEWIVDPIDGTMNYVHDFPYWCCSVAVRRNGTMLAGCVFAPEYDAGYSATADGPALRNGEPIRVSETADLREAIVFTGISKHVRSPEELHFDVFRNLALSTRKLRINGAAALDLCHLAAGVADGFYETTLYLWDHAAAGLIAQRAGARLEILPLDLEPHACTVLCATPALFPALRETCLPAG